MIGSRRSHLAEAAVCKVHVLDHLHVLVQLDREGAVAHRGGARAVVLEAAEHLRVARAERVAHLRDRNTFVHGSHFEFGQY